MIFEYLPHNAQNHHKISTQQSVPLASEYIIIITTMFSITARSVANASARRAATRSTVRAASVGRIDCCSFFSSVL